MRNYANGYGNGYANERWGCGYGDRNGDGWGCGECGWEDGGGFGDGCGYGYGWGDGYGDWYGDGEGDGFGYDSRGDGWGWGLQDVAVHSGEIQRHISFNYPDPETGESIMVVCPTDPNIKVIGVGNPGKMEWFTCRYNNNCFKLNKCSISGCDSRHVAMSIYEELSFDEGYIHALHAGEVKPRKRNPFSEGYLERYPELRSKEA